MNILHTESWKKTRILDLFFLTYVLTLVILLVMPTEGSIKLNKYFLGIRTDHFIHAALFLPILPYFRFKLSTKITFKVFKTYFVMGILFATFCESLQLLVPYRSFDSTDIMANVVGISLGGIAFLWKSESKSE